MSNKTKICYLLDNSAEYSYRLELSEQSFISFSDKNRLIFKRPLKDSEIDAIYKFLGQIRLPINRAQDEGLNSIRLRPQIKNKLTIQSKTVNANLLWDNSDEASIPFAYGYLKNLTDYIEAILPLEAIGVSRSIPE